MRVNVGCGQTPTPGWCNFDNSPSLLGALNLLERGQVDYIKFARDADITYGDATKRLPLPSASVEVLYSSHMIEHLDRTETRLFLGEVRRLLTPAGIVRIAAPDIAKQARRYVENKDADEFIEATHLTQPRPRSLRQKLRVLFVGTRHHQWMYDGPSLCRLLHASGFERARVLEPGETIIPDPGALNLHEREEESVYVEALKGP